MYKLVIADDEYEIRNGLSHYFPWSDIGFEVVKLAENGKEALTYIETHCVDVLLCDIKMPLLTGIDVAKTIYTNHRDIKIIFLSGYKDFNFAKKAMEYGVKDYILKPTKYNELVDVFSRIKKELDAFHFDSTSSSEFEKKTSSTDSLGYNERIIIIITDYIKDNFRDVTLEDLSKIAHLNPQYLSKFFKEKTGMNISAYILKVKMEKAEELLNNIEYKIYEISEMVGYSNPKNFTRTFKKYFGKNPRQYRNNT